MDKIIIKAHRKAATALDRVLWSSDMNTICCSGQQWQKWMEYYIQKFQTYAAETTGILPDQATHINEVDKMIEDTLRRHIAERKTRQMLKTMADHILADILNKDKDVVYTIRLQKNGKLCCRIADLAPWMPGKILRTTWEELHDEFESALNQLKMRRQHGIFYA